MSRFGDVGAQALYSLVRLAGGLDTGDAMGKESFSGVELLLCAGEERKNGRSGSTMAGSERVDEVKKEQAGRSVVGGGHPGVFTGPDFANTTKTLHAPWACLGQSKGGIAIPIAGSLVGWLCLGPSWTSWTPKPGRPTRQVCSQNHAIARHCSPTSPCCLPCTRPAPAGPSFAAGGTPL